MKTLSVKLVRKALAEMGFVDSPNGYGYPENELHMGFIHLSPSIYVQWTPKMGNIEFHDARWTEAPNVHIVSYFGFPRNKKELAKMISEVRRIYGTLCRIQFKEA